MCTESPVDEAAPAASFGPRTLVLRYTQAIEWRVGFEALTPLGAAHAVERAVNESGLLWRPGVDPASIRFGVE